MIRLSMLNKLKANLLPSQQGVGFLILGQGVIGDFRRQFDARVFVESDGFQIVAQELLVKAFLDTTGLILISRPES